MHKQSADPREPERLPVRVRQIFGDGQTELTQLSVFCPERETSMELEACLECEHCVGFSGTARETLLLCHPERKAAAPVTALEEATTPARGTRIAEIMARDVVCVLEDLTLADLASLLTTRSISGAPVVDAHGRPVGMISKSDLVRWWRQRSPEERRVTRVKQIMMPVVFSLPAETSVAKAAALMASEGIHRLCVVGREREVVGMLSTMDLVRWMARAEGYLGGGEHR